MLIFDMLCSFKVPMEIGSTPQSLLWLIPITLSISIIYKASKLKKITPLTFIKETAGLFLSILAFMAIVALVLHGFSLLVL